MGCEAIVRRRAAREKVLSAIVAGVGGGYVKHDRRVMDKDHGTRECLEALVRRKSPSRQRIR